MKTSKNGKYAVVYKIVNFYNNSYIITIKDLTLSYKLNRWTIPIIGKIFAFEDYTSAEDFLSSQLAYGTIYKAVAKISESRPKVIMRCYYGLPTIQDFWKYGPEKLDYLEFSSIPKGTVFCDKLKLLTRIDP